MHKFRVTGTQLNSTKNFIKYLVKRFRRAHIINPYASNSAFFAKFFKKNGPKIGKPSCFA
jgi:hypothetical protein